MQVQNRGRRHRGVRFRLLAVEGRRDEHSDAHQSGIGDLKPNLGGADVGIENRQNVVDAALEDLVGIGVQVNIRVLADVHGVEIIFVNVADDPDIGKIGDGEGIREPEVPARPPRW